MQSTSGTVQQQNEVPAQNGTTANGYANGHDADPQAVLDILRSVKQSQQQRAQQYTAFNSSFRQFLDSKDEMPYRWSLAALPGQPSIKDQPVMRIEMHAIQSPGMRALMLRPGSSDQGCLHITLKKVKVFKYLQVKIRYSCAPPCKPVAM